MEKMKLEMELLKLQLQHASKATASNGFGDGNRGAGNRGGGGGRGGARGTAGAGRGGGMMQAQQGRQPRQQQGRGGFGQQYPAPQTNAPNHVVQGARVNRPGQNPSIHGWSRWPLSYRQGMGTSQADVTRISKNRALSRSGFFCAGCCVRDVGAPYKHDTYSCMYFDPYTYSDIIANGRCNY